MGRFLLWLLLFYVIWKIVQSVTARPRSGSPQQHQKNASSRGPKNLSNIPDAEFEDITPKSSPPTVSSKDDQ